MPGFSNVVVIGHLGRDPEVRYSPKGTAVSEVSLAVNDGYGEKEHTSWVSVTCFGRAAELLGQYFKKGAAVGFQGKLREDTWEDKESGQKRSKLKVVADSIIFLGKREEGEEKSGRKSAPASEPANAPDPSDDNIPF